MSEEKIDKVIVSVPRSPTDNYTVWIEEGEDGLYVVVDHESYSEYKNCKVNINPDGPPRDLGFAVPEKVEEKVKSLLEKHQPLVDNQIKSKGGLVFNWEYDAWENVFKVWRLEIIFYFTPEELSKCPWISEGKDKMENILKKTSKLKGNGCL